MTAAGGTPIDFDIDQLPDGVLVLDAENRVQAANAIARELLGDVASVVGQHVGTAFDVRTGAGEPALRGQLPGHGSEKEFTFVGAGGEDVAINVTAAESDDAAVLCLRPVGDASGMAIVSTVSHELRSPLTSVKGYISLMLSRWDRIEDSKKREMLEQVHNDADRVTRLITELLDISRLETGRLVLRRQNLSLADLAETVVAKVKMGYPTLECSVDVPADMPMAYADPDKLEQVFTNLVENAAKYGSPVGMRVVGAQGDGKLSIAVTDTGDGIPADKLPKVFNKFFRADGGHGRPTGTGLGLWISRGLVEAHGGELTAESSVGEGSTFKFTLPADAFEQAHG